ASAFVSSRPRVRADRAPPAFSGSAHSRSGRRAPQDERDDARLVELLREEDAAEDEQPRLREEHAARERPRGHADDEAADATDERERRRRLIGATQGAQYQPRAVRRRARAADRERRGRDRYDHVSGVPRQKRVELFMSSSSL